MARFGLPLEIASYITHRTCRPPRRSQFPYRPTGSRAIPGCGAPFGQARRIDQALAAYRESLAQYQKSVLIAYQEVDDQLAALRIVKGEAQSETAAVDVANKAEQIATNRYTHGLASYLDVLYAQTALLANQRVLTQISGQRMIATVVLIKAIGDGITSMTTDRTTGTKGWLSEHLSYRCLTGSANFQQAFSSNERTDFRLLTAVGRRRNLVEASSITGVHHSDRP
jgi:hypothetical protein